MYIGNLQATFASPDAAPTIRTANSKAIDLTVAPGQNAHDRPLILEEESVSRLHQKNQCLLPLFVIFAVSAALSLETRSRSVYYTGTPVRQWQHTPCTN